MFLDDELYFYTKNKDIDSPNDFKDLVNELYKIVENYFKPKLSKNMTYVEASAMMDKAFKLWDMFTSKLEKENWFLIDVLKESSYKKQFMSNPELKRIYELGKKQLL